MNIKDAKPGMRVKHKAGRKGEIRAVYTQVSSEDLYVRWDDGESDTTFAYNCEPIPKFKVGDTVHHRLVDMFGVVLEVKTTASIDDLKVRWSNGKIMNCASANCEPAGYTTVKKEAKMQTQKLKTGVFIVGSLEKETGKFNIAYNPIEHATLEEAKVEAERLTVESAINSYDYVVLEVKGTVSRSVVTWR